MQLPYTSEDPSGFPDAATEKNTRTKTIKERLLEAATHDPDLPALGNSIARIIQLSSSDDQSIQQLAYFVLADVSLTQKILRLSNSVAYRTGANKVNTNITKAIFLLGFNSVKTCALAMLLVDGMSGKRAELVRTELVHALAASMISRELVKASHFIDAEETAITALFKNLARLLLAAYDHDLYQEMMALMAQGTHTPVQASMQVLGFNLDTLTETILEKWCIPSTIIQGLRSRPFGNLGVARSKQEWMQQVAEFSEKVAPLVVETGHPEDPELRNKLLTRFGKALNLDKSKLDQLILDAKIETRALLINANLLDADRSKTVCTEIARVEFNTPVDEDLLSELIIGHDEAENTQIIQRYPSGKPYNASALLLTGVQDVSEIMAPGNYKLDSLIMLVLETYYNSLGFRFITLCLRDLKMNQYRARSSLGENNMDYQKAFSFPMTFSTDVFHLALKRNADLLISDACTAKIHTLIPQWHRDLFPDARSFMVLPLVANNKPIGLFYANREAEAPEGITADEIRLVKTLKGQALTALNSR
ncbi:HDOD domain-containing protein [Nitrosomonas sp. Is24]|uniref:HDOD domain-containing protein n=1 Tax=Nitrosomonas sp. Is24 TaxID=3080533 RepID=UPI00294B23A3|nr:HDOD domain-containing protein [Nitrosomonas sp. Is24]MDV6341864.1 HDOD domain-containing protein [Nitrosomonas sp. Is24]